MEFYKTESLTRPLDVDTESSAHYNYVRQNIEEVEREENGQSITVYIYDECKIPKESWALYLTTVQNTADIEYIAAMTDVDLEG